MIGTRHVGEWKQSCAIRALRRGLGRRGRLRARAVGPGRTGGADVRIAKVRRRESRQGDGTARRRGHDPGVRGAAPQHSGGDRIDSDGQGASDGCADRDDRPGAGRRTRRRRRRPAPHRPQRQSRRAQPLVAGAPRRDRRGSGRPPAHGRKSAAGDPGAIGRHGGGGAGRDPAQRDDRQSERRNRATRPRHRRSHGDPRVDRGGARRPRQGHRFPVRREGAPVGAGRCAQGFPVLGRVARLAPSRSGRPTSPTRPRRSRT